MKKNLIFLLLFFSIRAFPQINFALVTDSLQINTRLTEDSITEYNFKNRHELDGNWIVYYDKFKKQKAIEARFNKGKLIGKEKHWYPNGQLQQENNDYNDFSIFNKTLWYPNGKLYLEIKSKNDTITTNYFYENGNVKKTDKEAIDSVEHFPFWFYSIMYCDNGNVKFSPYNPNSHEPQLIIGYYCNGSKKSECTLNFGDRVEKYNEWFENGQLKIVGQYNSEQNPDQEHTEKTGIWYYFNPDGKQIRQEKYENGKLTDMQEY